MPIFREALRYAVLNPARAGLCDLPEQWLWSSYRACVGLTFVPSFLAADELLRLFGPRPREARQRYREFVAAAAGVMVSDAVTKT
jgi:putative transposase